MKPQFKITSFSGFFYIHDKNTGKLLVEKSFQSYESALNYAKKL